VKGCKSINLLIFYTFLSAKTMFDTFEGNMEGIYISPSNLYLDRAMAAMEALKQQTYPLPEWELTPTLMQLCGAGDHIVS
jgi:methionine-gamma-lyase